MKKHNSISKILRILLAFVLAGAMLPLGAFGTSSQAEASPASICLPNSYPTIQATVDVASLGFLPAAGLPPASADANVETPIASGALSSSSARHLARTSDGAWHCVYHRSDGTYTQIYRSQSTDEGETWTEEQITTAPLHHYYPSVAIDSDDNIHVAWIVFPDGDPIEQSYGYLWPGYPGYPGRVSTVQYRVKTTAWQSIEDVKTGYHTALSIAVDSENNVHLVIGGHNPGAWNCEGINYAKRTASGWGPIERVSSGWWTAVAAIAVDESNDVHVVYGHAPYSDTRQEIIYRQRTSSGWGSEIQLQSFGNAASGGISIAVDTNDCIHVVWGWQDLQGDNYGIKYRRFTTSWQPTEDIDGPSIYCQRNPSITIDSGDHLHVVWSGQHADSPDYYQIRYREYTASWQPIENLTSSSSANQTNPSLMWAFYPTVGGIKTNEPEDGYSFVWMDGMTIKYFENYGVGPGSRTWHVDDDFADYPAADFTKIQEAVDAASSGDTIVVYSGTYTENIDVNKDRLIIQSEGGAEVTIVQAANANDHVFEVIGNRVNMSGFTVTGASVDQSGAYAGICLSGVEYCHISSNNVTDNWDGIALYASSGNSIENNTANLNVDGIHLYATSNNNIIKNNTACHNFDGIDLDPSSNNTIVGNVANFNTDDGISLDGSQNNTIMGNTANWNNGDEGNGIELDYGCENNIVVDNKLSNNNHGIELQYWNTNNTILNNEASDNTCGIYLEESNNNIIYLNNLRDNGENVHSSDLTNTWNSPEPITYIYNGDGYTSYLGNYWSDYAGSDTDGDGIGDTPYPVDSDADNYPLVEPCENYAVVSEIVTFADPNLEAAIREVIGKPTEPIDASDLEGLGSLYATGMSIVNLSGLEYCTSLTWLSLGYNEVSDISPLANLNNLTYLYLSANQISDVSPVASLTTLTELELGFNQISDISPLANLNNLTYLYLSVNQIANILPLASLTNLTSLALSSNQISDISPLTDLSGLASLELSSNQIGDVSPLTNLTSLNRLWLTSNQISDLSPLAALTSLTTLWLGGNRISDVSALASLTGLTWLWLDSNQISDILPLTNLTNLTKIYLQSNEISDISPLLGNSKLGAGDSVDLRSNPLSVTSVNTYIPQLEARGVKVLYDMHLPVLPPGVWTRADTPSMQGWVLAPGSTIIDYAVSDGGVVAYAIVNTDGQFHLLESTDSAATWQDLTDALSEVLEAGQYITELVRVACDVASPTFVAVALEAYDGIATYGVHVYISIDGGVTFTDAGEIEDNGLYLEYLSDLVVSPEVGGKRDIAIGGVDDSGGAALFRCTVTGDSAGDWEDATEYPGWDVGWDPFTSELVTDIIFSTSWATDKTILVTTIDVYDGYWDSDIEYGAVYLQCGSWGTTAGWNEYSTLGIEAVPILDDVDLPMWLVERDTRAIAGMTLPSDYSSKTTDDRMLWMWVNYYDEYGNPSCVIIRVDNDSADPVGPLGQIKDGKLWLTNVSYKGTIAEGEAIAGLLGTGTYDPVYGSPDDLLEECCYGVQVYRHHAVRNMEICCEPWRKACKPPTGRSAMAVSYVGEGKAYAVALQGFENYDEGAWSVSLDDGDTWNQLSLIDTHIDYFSDVAVSPDCNKTMLVSVNEENGCQCDSVWLHAENLPEAEEYSGKWLRTWCGQLEGLDYGGYEHGILRLAPEETTGDTIYLADLGSGNVYRNDLETLACWDPIASTVLGNIVDLAAQDTDTIFALDANGDVGMFDEVEWNTGVNSTVGQGWTVAVRGDHILVGGCDGNVSYSNDGGQTFDLLEGSPTIAGYITVAFDTYFDTNNVIYAATEEEDNTGGIYSWVIGESEEWTDLEAVPLESQLGVDDGDGEDEAIEITYTGLVVDRPGNPFTSSNNGGVIYASYYGYAYDESMGWVWFTGTARSLERDVSVCTTCLQWDFLHVGLTIDVEGFDGWPDALKICGCLTPDSNTHLFAINSWWDYDMFENEYGSVWTYEDCYAKKAPKITGPADGTVIPADPFSCYSAPFTVLWDSVCDACAYDIAFAMDEDFTMPVPVNGEIYIYVVVSDTPSFSVMGGEAGGLSCETTYYIRIRGAIAASGEIIHSWWSDPIAITIAPSVETGMIDLISPAPGALNQPIKNVGFSWDLEANADAFHWVLSANADLSSPLDSKTGLTSKATTCTGTLSHGTTYYWQVKAYNEGALIGTSAIGSFTTANFAGEIWDWYDLDAIRYNPADSYILMNDLDSTTAGYAELVGETANDGKGWQPIGTDINPFSGTFDGHGYDIGDLFINRPGEHDVGLFSFIFPGGVIKNIGVVNANVTGGEYDVGVLAGASGESTTVSNSHSTGSVSGYWDVGGLVGFNNGNVTKCYFTGSVTGNQGVGGLVGNNQAVGGQVGQTSGTISSSYSISNVTGSEEKVGGLVGFSIGIVSDCYASSTVTGGAGASGIGGLVGFVEKGIVSNCYASGNVTGWEDVGGLVGLHWGTVMSSYSTCAVAGDIYVGGLLGESTGNVSDSFWDTEISGHSTSAGGTGKTTMEMTDIATFADTVTEGLDQPWDITAVASGETNPAYMWNIVDGETYPFLSWQWRTWYVDDDLVDYPHADFTKIQDAVDTANPGDMIIVYPGTYTENVDVNKGNLTIQSEDGAEVTIVQAANPDDHVFEVTADYVEMNGFTAEGATGIPDGWARAGIYLESGVSHCRISNNDLTSNYFGIWLNSSSGNIITGNTASENNVGINLWSPCYNNTITRNTANSNAFAGICLYLSCYNTLTSNTANSNGDLGIRLYGSSSNILTGNTLNSNNQSGLLLQPSGVGDLYSNNNIITYNTISWNNEYGIVLQHDSNENEIYINDFVDNSDNVYCEGSANTWNSPEEMTYTYDGNFYINYLGNYWSDYAGSDADGDGIGDTPYPVDSDADSYPLVEPFENYEIGTEIYDWYDLDAIRNNLSGRYVLMNDLDPTTAGYEELAGPTANDGKGWQPIGPASAPFTGTFNGQGYEINDLFVNRPDEWGSGLFGFVGSGALIQNVGVVDVVITCYTAVGGITGASRGIVSNCYSTGSVTGSREVGGLAGINEGTISNSYSACSVTGDTFVGGLAGDILSGTVSNSYSTGSVAGLIEVGGLTGENRGGTITNSYSTGSVSGSWYVGGLVGLVEEGPDATITNSYSNGSVSGDWYVGGLVGTVDGTVSNSYSAGSVAGNYYIGGLVAANYGTVNNSYSRGNVTGHEYAGGLVAVNWGGIVSSSFWDIQTSGQSTSAGGTGKTSAEMKDVATFTDIETVGLDTPWDMIAVAPRVIDPAYTWNIIDGRTYPFLSCEQTRGTPVTRSKTETITDGILDAKVEADTEVEVWGTATVTVSRFADNPGGGPPTGFNSLGKYIDIYIPDTKDVDEMEIRLYYRAAEVPPGVNEASLGLLWWDGTDWGQCSNSGVNTEDIDAYSGYMWARIADDTTPTLAQLSGTPFGGHHSPLLVHYELTMEAVPPGSGVALDWTDESPYLEGAEVSIEAIAVAGYIFVDWTAPAGTFGNAYASSTIFTMPGQAVTVMANFAAISLVEYEIWDWYDLDAVRNNLDGIYVLMNNLDSTTPGYAELASPTANGGKGWEPIGTFDNQFTGILDGQGYEIGDLFINRLEAACVGLFGAVGQEGVVQNIGVVHVTVTGTYDVGGLVGGNMGTVSNSYSTGSVTGGDGVGGLVGINIGTVPGTVSNSYSTSSVTGSSYVGGLVGWNKGIVSNSYSKGSVTGSNLTGGLVGSNTDTVANSFWDVETSGIGVSDGGTGKTTEQMMNIDTFSDAAWSMIAVGFGVVFPVYTWNIVDDKTYPFLSWEEGNRAVAVDSKTDTVTDDGTIDAKIEADTEVEVTGNATVIVAELADNPGGDLPAGFKPLDKHIDVYVPDTSQVTEVEIRLYYTNAEVVAAGVIEASLRLFWWDGEAWAECSDTGVNTQNTGDYSGYMWAEIRADTIPTLDYLAGGYFKGGGMSAPQPHPEPPSPPHTPASYKLTIASTAGGSVIVLGEGTAAYKIGDTVTVVAEAAEGYRFVNWIGDVDAISDVYAATTTIKMDRDYQVAANFVAIWDLAVSSTGGGLVPSPGEGTFIYDAGTLVDLVAEAQAGYRFVGWTSNVDGVAYIESASITITMDGDYSVTAHFVAQYDLTIDATNGGEVTTPGEGTFTYDEGTVVNLVASPQEGYRFVNWIGDVETVTDVYAATTTITMNGDYSVTCSLKRTIDWLLIGGIMAAVVAAGLVAFSLLRRRRKA